VLLKLSANGLTGDEYVKEWLFNFEGVLAELTFGDPDVTGEFDLPEINTGEDMFRAAGDGYYDIEFAFAKNNNNRGARRFGVGDELTVSITGADITAAMFNVESAPGGGKGPFLSVAHVGGVDRPDLEGVDDDGSGWVTVPDASTLFLLGSACLIGFAVSRKRSAK
jgi:hypothetical protein